MEVHGGPSKRKRRKQPDPEWLEFMSDDEKERRRIRELCQVTLSDVGLPVRVVNTLENQKIFTLGDLARITGAELAAIPNLGEITIRRCQNLLADFQLPNRLHQR
jgi:DNA-directed RNA polymerase alpha subunit